VVPKIDCVESRDNFGRFLATPLEKGFGVTLGNSLRRVLLSYLSGAAVTRIKIDGILHEFSAIPYVKEDVTEFTLNVKQLRLIPVSGEGGKLVLDVSGEGQVRAADIKTSTEFEIANPELHLATLDSADARLYVEFDVEMGVGYQSAGFGGELPIAPSRWMPSSARSVRSILRLSRYMPVRRVAKNKCILRSGRMVPCHRLRQ